ncbi:Tricalbin-2, partial [Basidiobolus ranarum]
MSNIPAMPSVSENTLDSGNVPNEPGTLNPTNSPNNPTDNNNTPNMPGEHIKEPYETNVPNMPNMPNMPMEAGSTVPPESNPVVQSPPVISPEHTQLTKEEAQQQIDVELSKSNTPVHTFNPEDSPEEKVRKAKEAAGSVITNNPLLSGPNVTKGIISDVSLDKNDESSHPLARSSTTATNKSATSTASSLPPPVIGWKESNEKFLETYSGQEWQNALCLVTLVVVTYILVSLGLGFGWCMIVLIFAAQYYINSVKRFRRNVKDDITRQLSIAKLLTDTESTEWLNTFLSKFWLIYEPVLSATIVGIADGILAASTPGFLDSLRLSEFTLGTKAPRVESVKTFTNDDEEVVEMEWDVSFTPNDLEDLTPRQVRNKTNPKVVLEVRVGKGFVGAGMPILVEDIAFSGRMRIKLKLMSNFPHMQAVDLSFMEPPEIDYVLKPLGGETFGFDIAHIPGLSSFIKEQIHAVLGPMMYNPHVFTLDMEQLISGVDTEAAIGILKVHIRHARNLKNLEVLGLSDPYVRLHINNRAELGRTAVKENTLNPTWDETFFILVHNLNETLLLEIFDKEEIKKDRSLGTASFNMATLLDTPNQDYIAAKVIREGGKERGEVYFDVMYYPVVEPTIQEDGTPTHVESNHGILKVFVHQAKDLDKTASTKLNPYGIVKLNGTKILTTKVLKRKANPVWEDPV